MKRKRLVRGRDWHAWAWKHLGEDSRYLPYGGFIFGAEYQRNGKPTEKGKWVRVKFVEAKP